MISNFNEVEKSLKRCLKEKISITTATVVGFLIAGTVAFGGLLSVYWISSPFLSTFKSNPLEAITVRIHEHPIKAEIISETTRFFIE